MGNCGLVATFEGLGKESIPFLSSSRETVTACATGAMVMLCVSPSWTMTARDIKKYRTTLKQSQLDHNTGKTIARGKSRSSASKVVAVVCIEPYLSS